VLNFLVSQSYKFCFEVHIVTITTARFQFFLSIKYTKWLFSNLGA